MTDFEIRASMSRQQWLALAYDLSTVNYPSTASQFMLNLINLVIEGS